MADPLLFRRLINRDDIARYETSSREAAARLEPWEFECRLNAKDGTERWLRLTATPQRVGDVLTWHGYVADVTRRCQQEIENARLAFYDPLTHLPNRRKFLERMNEDAGLGHGKSFGALLFIDLDNFKTLNDTQGHDVGDAFLVQVAARLSACVGRSDMIARLGGDEFVVVLGARFGDGAQATRDAILLGHRVLDAMQEPFALGRVRHVGSASIGVVVFDRSEQRVDEVLKRADLAMYQAKAAGRNRLALFDPASLEREADRFKLTAELRSAIAEKQFVLHFQPVLDDERHIVGAEALVRWDHPTRGIIMPEQFMALADASGLGSELSAAIVEQGVAALSAWQADPQLADLRLALNVDARVFADQGFAASLIGALERHAADARKLTLELTETVLACRTGGTVAQMHHVRDFGVSLALDDFGRGSASILQLKELPFDVIKIDGSFVADIEKSDGDRALVKTILAMARTLKVKTVAEHVENVRQEAFLRAFGCDFFQGYLYAPPMTARVFEDFVRQGRDLRPAPFNAGRRESAGNQPTISVWENQ